MHQLQHWINWVYLPPFLRKIGAVRVLVVIVLEQFAEHEKVERRGVLGMVVIVVVLVAIFMAAPVDDGTVEWTHHVVDGQQQEHPPMRCEDDVEYGVSYHPHDAGRPFVAEFVQLVPGWVIAQELWIDINSLGSQAVENALGMHHHSKYVLEEIRGMRILHRVGIGMVHPVHDGVGTGCQIGRTLCHVCSQVKKPLPRLAHREHLVRCVTVVEKGLEEEADEPMCEKKPKNYHNLPIVF